jgi:hypothetical protein
MPRPPANDDLPRQKRQLRLKLARARRRIDRRVRTAERRTRELASWRTYARRYPGNVLLGAFGVGLAFSAGLGGRRFTRWMGLRLVGRTVREGRRLLVREFERLWADATPRRDPAPGGPSRAGDDAPG